MTEETYVMNPGTCVECEHYTWYSVNGLNFRQCAVTDYRGPFPGKRCAEFKQNENIDMRVLKHE